MARKNLASHLVSRAAWALLAQDSIRNGEVKQPFVNHAENPHALDIEPLALLTLLHETGVFTFEHHNAYQRIIASMVLCAEALNDEDMPKAKLWLAHEMETHDEDYDVWLTWAKEVTEDI